MKSPKLETKKNGNVLNYFVLVIILAVSFWINFISLTNGIGTSDDWSAYLMQARLLAEHGNAAGLIDNSSFIFNNSTHLFGPILYPWGWPVLLAPVYKIFGLNFIALKTYDVIFFTFFLLGIYLLTKSLINKTIALGITLIFAFNPIFLNYSILNDYLYSDVPYASFCVFSLYFIQKFIIKQEIFINKFISYMLLGLFIFFSYFIRQNGLVLLGALATAQIVVNKMYLKNIKQFIAQFKIIDFVPYILFIALFIISIYAFPQAKDTRLSLLKTISFESIKFNFLSYAQYPIQLFNNNAILYILTAALFSIGVYKYFVSNLHIIAYLGGTLLLYIFFPLPDMRFIFSIFPIFIFFAIKAIPVVLNLIFKKPKSNSDKLINQVSIGFSVVLVFLVFFTKDNITLIKTNHKKRQTAYGVYSPKAQETVDFILGNTRPNDTIISAKPRSWWFTTDRIGYCTDKYADVISGKAQYLLINLVNNYTGIKKDDPELVNSKYLTKVFENGNYVLFKINKL